MTACDSFLCCAAVAMLVALLMQKPVGGRRQKKGQDWEMQAEREQQVRVSDSDKP